MENRSLSNIPEEAKSKEFKEIENGFYNQCGVPAETFTEEKTAPATGEILINEAEFDAAKDKVLDDMMKDPELEGISFAVKMKKILFHENKEV